MSGRVVSFVKPCDNRQATRARRGCYGHACKAGLLWVRDALGLLAAATLLAWLVVRFTI